MSKSDLCIIYIKTRMTNNFDANVKHELAMYIYNYFWGSIPDMYDIKLIIEDENEYTTIQH